ncbi:16S rRNA (cytosine(1402)-N(4))-methyltransferase RsmH [Lentisphaera profundi]|uniref:Ribosomal RNA small subunit methyltransferase H n=1 Tax=Lentisphaera profundi TaxID=1658616 RepID=A0ABY7VSC7_9BACT|nr:16S rRNA (cytosine(1402)-N(4))-methyltransferase RsmH [Lentisphaera profundi]WDE95679.1 16S rRNA (cytosine(1402)-N(4))-methyltransferase RsmH [Lentisphaera profundi]
MKDFYHIPVLAEQVIHGLQPHAGGKYIDCTLGGGGHSSLILESAKDIQLLGLDCDDKALRAAKERLSKYGENFQSKRLNFRDLKDLKKDECWNQVDGILMDIGVSSHHLDEASRGFTYRENGPLDMRMDRRLKVTASMILNKESLEGLTKIFRDYGEMKEAYRLAKAIVADRDKELFTHTEQLAGLADRVCVNRNRRKRNPAPTLAFQALRIAVNDELGALESGMAAAFDLLKPGGRLAVISFHSLEDRMVKEFFKEKAVACDCPPDIPVCVCGRSPQMKIITRKPLTAESGELEENTRSACAKLRVAEKI